MSTSRCEQFVAPGPDRHCVMLVQVTNSMVSTQENMKGRQASGTENGRPAQGYILSQPFLLAHLLP